MMSMPVAHDAASAVARSSPTKWSGLEQEDPTASGDLQKPVADKLPNLPVRLPQVMTEGGRGKTRMTHSATVSRSQDKVRSLPRQRRHQTMSKITVADNGAPTRPGDPAVTSTKSKDIYRQQQPRNAKADQDEAQQNKQQRHRAEVYAINARMREFSQEQIAMFLRSQQSDNTVSPMGV
ncbi:hypothetical protein H310_11480 [Aphanomyces invadans]|uniref:Uncharacterized protein n=1 Tax=Aphanomyces invadans TaxID=157072 RepID=A0A024TMG3_9STRA|nr:hypothetical protein H310_11480 [Aphanomyces invadans]ETV94806.1 hypothetical protein H310_11480 [Aphanomyces invadans]|eukprot:XP_008876397.1 hypothetical protein H310_11480 [Aphanomyces invadans]